MKNSLALSAMIDRFNRTAQEDDHIHLNWGREGSRSTWYIHGKYGMGLKTGLRFYEIIDCVENAIWGQE